MRAKRPYQGIGSRILGEYAQREDENTLGIWGLPPGRPCQCSHRRRTAGQPGFSQKLPSYGEERGRVALVSFVTEAAVSHYMQPQRDIDNLYLYNRGINWVSLQNASREGAVTSTCN